MTLRSKKMNQGPQAGPLTIKDWETEAVYCYNNFGYGRREDAEKFKAYRKAVAWERRNAIATLRGKDPRLENLAFINGR